jgi:hypothetical protein
LLDLKGCRIIDSDIIIVFFTSDLINYIVEFMYPACLQSW